ncbi:MAG: YCF48-related protein [Pyrinomonadaceae bacterium]
MRTIATIFLFILISSWSLYAQAGWVLQTDKVPGDLVAVFFTSSDNGWVAGDNGYLASTTDGGRTWTKVALNTTEDINEIYFRNDENGYLVAGRKMFITRDAGRNWQETRIARTGDFGSGTPEFLSIRFSDKKHGYVVGSVLRRNNSGDEIVVDSLLMRTEDAGDTWRRINVPTKAELFHLDFNGNSHGWIVGDGGVILASTDEGKTWTKQTSGTLMPLYNVDFRDDDEGYIVGKTGTILRTSNGGVNWEKVSTNFKETLMRVDFADDKNGWIVGYKGNILRSNDKGKNWIKQESNTRESLYGLFMDKKYGWAVGAKGVILQYKK